MPDRHPKEREGAMTTKQSLIEPGPDFLSPLERDMSFIRREMMAVLRETADVRATMSEISSYRRAASKRFIVVSGLICFILLAGLVIYQPQLRSWLRLM